MTLRAPIPPRPLRRAFKIHEYTAEFSSRIERLEKRLEGNQSAVQNKNSALRLDLRWSPLSSGEPEKH